LDFTFFPSFSYQHINPKISGFASFMLQADLVQKFSLKAIQDSFWCNLLLGTQTYISLNYFFFVKFYEPVV
jgi:hypothetical protein